MEVDLAPATEDELVDDGRREFEIDVLAVEDAGVGGEHVLGDVLDEIATRVGEAAEELVRMLDITACQELQNG